MQPRLRSVVSQDRGSLITRSSLSNQRQKLDFAAFSPASQHGEAAVDAQSLGRRRFVHQAGNAFEPGVGIVQVRRDLFCRSGWPGCEGPPRLVMNPAVTRSTYTILTAPMFRRNFRPWLADPL